MVPFKLILASKSFLINHPDHRLMTALHYAAEEGFPAMTKMLLGKGAIPTGRNRMNETPLHAAAAKGSKWVIEALVERSPRASINDRDHFGWTPTQRAVTLCNEALINFLVNLPDVDLNIQDKHGRSVVAFVAACGTPETLEMVLQVTGKDISQHIDYFGNTLLHIAAKEENLATTQYILSQLELSAKNELNFRG